MLTLTDFDLFGLSKMVNFSVKLLTPITLHVSHSEYPRNKPFLLIMVSYLKENREKMIEKRKRKSHEPFQSYLLTG